MAIEISDASELQAMENDLTADYVLVNDIDASGTSSWNGGAGFDPVGDHSTTAFTGSLDFAGFGIDALFINRPSTNDVGLFGKIEGSGTFATPKMTNADITGDNRVGVLVGFLNGASVNINDMDLAGSATVEARQAGAIGRFDAGTLNGGTVNVAATAKRSTGLAEAGPCVGLMIGGAVKRIKSAGSATSSGLIAGGFVGDVRSGTIDECGATASASAAEAAGGFYGRNDGGAIADCYATGDAVVTNQRVGGFGGQRDSGTEARTYSTGTPSGTSTSIGGWLGIDQGGSDADSFWDTETSGQATSAGSATGKTTAEMQSIDTYTDTNTTGLSNPWDMVAGVDETKTWGIDPSINDGYPFLQALADDEPEGDTRPRIFESNVFHSPVFGATQ